MEYLKKNKLIYLEGPPPFDKKEYKEIEWGNENIDFDVKEYFKNFKLLDEMSSSGSETSESSTTFSPSINSHSSFASETTKDKGKVSDEDIKKNIVGRWTFISKEKKELKKLRAKGLFCLMKNNKYCFRLKGWID